MARGTHPWGDDMTAYDDKPEVASDGMARLLELAANNADVLRAEATAAADTLRSDAHAEAERVTSEAQAEADRLLGEARLEAERIRSESEEAKNRASQEIADLRKTEREHRERMQSHLQEMLAKVEANSIG
jgi:cell division septum initiation protein DivIVA